MQLKLRKIKVSVNYALSKNIALTVGAVGEDSFQSGADIPFVALKELTMKRKSFAFIACMTTLCLSPVAQAGTVVFSENFSGAILVTGNVPQ